MSGRGQVAADLSTWADCPFEAPGRVSTCRLQQKHKTWGQVRRGGFFQQQQQSESTQAAKQAVPLGLWPKAQIRP